MTRRQQAQQKKAPPHCTQCAAKRGLWFHVVCLADARHWMSLLYEIVIYLDAEDYHRRGGGDEIRNCMRQIVGQDALKEEEKAAKAHQKECRQRNAVCVASADGIDGLGHIAHNHTYRCCVAYDIT